MKSSPAKFGRGLEKYGEAVRVRGLKSASRKVALWSGFGGERVRKFRVNAVRALFWAGLTTAPRRKSPCQRRERRREQAMSGGYDQVVSLGRACQPAYQIRRLVPGAIAHVFDWIITNDHGLVSLIEAELNGHFARERLIMGPQNCIIDRETKTQFLHEFPRGCDFEERYPENAERIAMLTERWHSLLASEQRVLFVRQHGWDADLRATAIRLRETIAAKAPRLRFTLLYLTETEEADWGEEGIVNRRLNQPEPYVWTGDDAAWSQILNDALARPADLQRV
jgi:hypothetical protein